jgi:hypothetical protein
MNGTFYADGKWYIAKDLDSFLSDITKEVSLKDLIENQEFTLRIHDSLESMVTDGRLEKTGGDKEEDELFEDLRKTIKVLKKKLALENTSSKPEAKLE